MADRTRPTLRKARIIARGTGTANLVGLGQTYVEDSDFVFADGSRLHVDLGQLVPSGQGEPMLIVQAGRQFRPQMPGGQDVRDEPFKLPACVTVEDGDLIPSIGLRSTEGHTRFRRPGRLLSWIAGGNGLI